jgi:hypothetical protein
MYLILPARWPLRQSQRLFPLYHEAGIQTNHPSVIIEIYNMTVYFLLKKTDILNYLSFGYDLRFFDEGVQNLNEKKIELFPLVDIIHK